MEQRFVGTTGLSVSTLAFGTMTFGKEATEHESARLYARCREAGINMFDCADVYANGRSETLLGGFIRAHRDEIVLATKAGFATGSSANARGSSRYHLVRACEASLRRLGTDRIDIYYVHHYDPVTSLEETLRGLETLVQQGKILYFGVSNFSAWQTQRAVDLCEREGLTRLACVQPMYSLLKRQAEVEILPMAEHNKLGVFPYSPLGGGLLTGKYVRGLPSSSVRHAVNPSYRARYAKARADQVVPGFLQVARELGVSPPALAVAWVMAHPAVTAPLLGARSVEQLEPSLAAATLKLDESTLRRLNELSFPPARATDRDEEETEHAMYQR